MTMDELKMHSDYKINKKEYLSAVGGSIIHMH
jgi:hypothetical protein